MSFLSGHGEQHPAAGNGKTQKKTRRVNKKAMRILRQIGIVLLLMIPLYLAIASYLVVKNKPQDSTETYYTSLELTSPSGYKITALPQSGTTGADGQLFDSFRQMLTGAVFAPGIPDTHTAEYALTMYTNTGNEQYVFFFSAEDRVAYYSDATGTVHRTADDTAAYFINSPHAYELYGWSAPPVLTSATTETILPSSLSWSYQTEDGTFADLNRFTVTNDVLTYPIANDVAFTFSPAPTSCSLVIKQDGHTLYEGNRLDHISLPSSVLTQGSVMDFEIRADFDQDSRLNYYGNAVYRFRMNVVEAASFQLDGRPADTALYTGVQGSYFMLHCLNVRNEENLVITADPALTADPVVFRRGEAVYAAIPADQAGDRRLTVTYGTVSRSFDLHITDRPTDTHTVKAADLRGDWKNALGGGMLAKYTEEKGAAADTAHFPFVPPTALARPVPVSPTYAFGDKLTVTDGTLQRAAMPFTLYAYSGQVSAMGAGTVSEINTDENHLLGKYVIVDHGGGLYTWYCGLSDVQVTDGMPIGVGQAIGNAGRTGLGLADTDCVLILTTWGKTPCAPHFV